MLYITRINSPAKLTYLGGGFKHVLFSPRILGEMIPFWRAYFSDGLVQPSPRTYMLKNDGWKTILSFPFQGLRIRAFSRGGVNDPHLDYRGHVAHMLPHKAPLNPRKNRERVPWWRNLHQPSTAPKTNILNPNKLVACRCFYFSKGVFSGSVGCKSWSEDFVEWWLGKT